MSAWCEGLPEEAAAACLALSLGEGNVSSYHLLPDPHFLLTLWRSEDHPAVLGYHEFREKLEQEQVSEILAGSSDRNYQSQKHHMEWNIFIPCHFLSATLNSQLRFSPCRLQVLSSLESLWVCLFVECHWPVPAAQKKTAPWGECELVNEASLVSVVFASSPRFQS